MVGEEKSTRGTMFFMDRFQKAVEKDDISEAMDLFSIHPETEWTENPLHIACKFGSHGVAMEIGRKCPRLATIANQDGDKAMHLVSAKGDVEMVEFLGKLNPGSFLEENNYSMIPLHIAVEKGHRDVIIKLVSLCPESLKKVTSKLETVFHLAVNSSHIGAFQVLQAETKKLNLGHLLNNKDNEGNTVLHIAAYKRLTGIVKLLLADESSSSSSHHIKQQLNWRNECGLTALDLCRANSLDIASQEISLILQKAADKNEISSLVPNKAPATRLPVGLRNVLLVVLVMIAAAAFTVTCDLPDALLKEISRSSIPLHATARDVISGRLPSIFYLMVFNTAGFMTSMAVISYLIWPLHLRSILIFVLVCTFIVYIILVDKITPKFTVSVGNFSVSSITLVLSSAVAFIFLGVTIIVIWANMLSTVLTCSYND